MAFRPLPYLAGVCALAAAYFATAKLGFSLAFVAEQVTIVWAPTGISLAALLLFGYRYWPGIAIGAFLANATANEPLAVAGGIALGNTLEAVVGAWLLRRVVGFQNPLERLRDVLGLVVLGAVLSTTVSATLGVTSLCLGGLQPWAAFGTLWWVWWLGDAMGDLIVVPLLLTWVAGPRPLWRLRQLAEATALLVGLGAASALAFSDGSPRPSSGYPLEYLLFPFVIWAALRFGQRGAAAVNLAALGLALWATVRRSGPFTGASLHENLILLHLFMAVLAVTGLLLGAITIERATAERRRLVGYAATAILAEATSLAEAAPQLLSTLCAGLRCDTGALWTIDPEAGVLRCVEVWTTSPGPLDEFASATRGHAFPPGVGLPGQVWSTRQPAWIADLARDSNFPRAPIASRAGLRSAFAFPIVLRGEILGVAEFFCRQSEKPDDDLVQLLAAIGGQAGLFIERRRAEESLRLADRRKDEFLATLAHELRNPLAPIRNALYILKVPGVAGPALETARALMERQVQHLVRLVDDLLDVSRIMRGRIELRRERVGLAAVIARAVETAQPLLDAGGQALTVSLPAEPILLDADPVRLAQVIANLLNNAAKYTERGGQVWLTAARQGDQALVRVRDTGVGIAADVLPRIFDLFVQSEHSRERSQGGLGIGLSLARSLAELHGGSVHARSDGAGHGSEFEVRLPALPGLAAVPPPVHVADPAPAARSLPRRTILVVDDNVDAAESLAELLRLKGQDVRVAHGGPAALEAARAGPLEMVFLDLGMPGMDGFEVARRLRQEPRNGRVLLVALTGWGQDADRRRTREAGFDVHLVKPVEPEVLHELLLTAALRRRHKPDA